MKFFANYLSWHDSFCLCGKTRIPHWLWLAARTGLRIFSDRQVARLDLFFKHSKARAKGSNGKQETHTTMQALKKIPRSEPHKSDGDGLRLVAYRRPSPAKRRRFPRNAEVLLGPRDMPSEANGGVGAPEWRGSARGPAVIETRNDPVGFAE
jgi:hypothetical protein